MPRAGDVRRLFDTIEPSYDRFTRWFSFGMDRRWKRAVRRLAERHAPGTRHVDLATGTGDLLFGPASVGIDFSARMLMAARRRAEVRVAAGDLMRLPLADASVDLLTAAYAFRNVEDGAGALAEARRVLVQDGVLVTLDFYRPEPGAWRRLFEGYLSVAGRAAGWLAHRDGRTYGYIARSLAPWVTADEFGVMMAAAGFTFLARRDFLGGGVVLHVGRKAEVLRAGAGRGPTGETSGPE